VLCEGAAGEWSADMASSRISNPSPRLCLIFLRQDAVGQKEAGRQELSGGIYGRAASTATCAPVWAAWERVTGSLCENTHQPLARLGKLVTRLGCGVCADGRPQTGSPHSSHLHISVQVQLALDAEGRGQGVVSEAVGESVRHIQAHTHRTHRKWPVAPVHSSMARDESQWDTPRGDSKGGEPQRDEWDTGTAVAPDGPFPGMGWESWDPLTQVSPSIDRLPCSV
jgi:hypothetical protein